MKKSRKISQMKDSKKAARQVKDIQKYRQNDRHEENRDHRQEDRLKTGKSTDRNTSRRRKTG